MKELFKDALFMKHILVADYFDGEDKHEVSCANALNTVITLARKFGIRITENAELADIPLVKDAARNLGLAVPEPFYRGFPNTVRAMTPNQLLYDQLMHYTNTYGMGWFDTPGHSMFERVPEGERTWKKRADYFWEMAFEETEWTDEKVPPKDFIILTEKLAEQELFRMVKNLMGSNRPLSPDQQMLVYSAWIHYPPENIMPEWIPCKKTAIMMLYKTKDLLFARYLQLADTIKLLEYIQYNEYGSEKLNKLNLKNKDRKLITRLLNRFFSNPERPVSYNDQIACFEKRKIWCGLLHHIHYQPKPGNKTAVEFVHSIRNGANRSISSRFERILATEGPVEAARYLSQRYRGNKGEMMRKLNYILSRCKNEDEIKEVFECLE